MPRTETILRWKLAGTLLGGSMIVSASLLIFERNEVLSYMLWFISFLCHAYAIFLAIKLHKVEKKIKDEKQDIERTENV
ncbi:hypothetical protein RYX56_00140 [Alkalihalophilus lindianensis]|uniref:Uncharacterized protein n=1 Tax=Alkalihalophilus lindianensis TaxID=1630542 RepID=A0ABU3X669_9BACI|nr:hypothetical protein [Alkalihalophilus lindianensis]